MKRFQNRPVIIYHIRISKNFPIQPRTYFMIRKSSIMKSDEQVAFPQTWKCSSVTTLIFNIKKL